jgi:hypothetical protein
MLGALREPSVIKPRRDGEDIRIGTDAKEVQRLWIWQDGAGVWPKRPRLSAGAELHLSASRNVSSKPGRTVKVGQCQCHDTMGPWLAYELLDEPVRGCAGFRSYGDVSPRSCLPEAHNSDIAEPRLYESQPHNLVVRLNFRDDRLNACFL